MSAVSELAERWEREADESLRDFGVPMHLAPIRAAQELREAIRADEASGDDPLMKEHRARYAALRAIAHKANQLVTDGLMPKATAVQIRDKALNALGAEGDEALRI